MSPSDQRATGSLLVTFAVRNEAASFRRRAAGGRGVEWLVTGMGARNAERALEGALDRAPRAFVLTCGFAGGLNPALPGRAALFDAEPGSALAAVLTGMGARPARFHTADRVITHAAEKARLWRSTGADAVEMESGAIRAACRARGIASATLRVISDAADEDLPLDFNRLVDADWNLRLSRVILALAGAPQRLPAVLRLRQRARAAAERLAEVLADLMADRSWQPSREGSRASTSVPRCS